MDKKKIRNLKVINKKKITLNMIRITLAGSSLNDFTDNEIGGYVKLIFKDKNKGKSLMRPYTIRKLRSKEQEIDIDFALHDKDIGYASLWAKKVKLGEKIQVTGPGSKSMFDLSCKWFFLVGDMSALPAMSVNIESLNDDYIGYAVIEVLSEEDKQLIRKPRNFVIHWVINPEPWKKNTKLLEKVLTIKWHNFTPFVWVACEFNNMKVLRNFFKNIKNIPKENLYISSYWKSGLNQEEHKIIKKKDSKNNL